MRYCYCQAVLPADEMITPCCTCSCDCVKGVTNAKKRMKKLVMSLMERLEQEEMMRKNSEQEMENIMIKLEILQKSLMSEQARVKTILQNKDNIIR